MRTLPALACLLLPLLGGGCDDQDEAKREQGSGRVIQGEATPLGDWLDARSTQSPTTWLVERMAASGQTITPAEVVALDQALAEADARFLESDRMIVNRSLQLSTMLREIGIDRSPIVIILDFEQAARGHQGALSFTKACELYVNSRRRGLDHAAAMRSFLQQS